VLDLCRFIVQKVQPSYLLWHGLGLLIAASIRMDGLYMAGTIPAFTLPFLTTLLFVMVLRPFAFAIGLVDRPGGRKRHVGNVPLIGGLAMFAGLATAAPSTQGSLIIEPALLASAALLVVVGVLDDRFDLPPSVRFLAQIIAALVMTVGAGLYASNIGPVFFGENVHLGRFAILFTILVVSSSINAFNMFDGSDGVAGGQALVCLLGLATAGLIRGQFDHLSIILALAGCICAFLVFNLPFEATQRVRVFMGDAGSTMLGFVLAWVAISMCQGPSAVIAPVTVLWIWALPLMDFFCSMVRRVLDGRSPFHADAEHLHHVLRRAGLSPMQIFLAETAGGLLFGTLGIAGHVLGVHDGVMFFGLLGLAVVYYFLFASGRVFKRAPEEKEDEVLDAAA
jgi:UDP-GlcNAc:undecaprenyl-phosphate GlcNAc-1-phosphate transferase